MNVFIRIGEWLDRKSTAERVVALAAAVNASTAANKELAAKVATLTEEAKKQEKRIAKVEMFTGLRGQAAGVDAIKASLDAWGRMPS